MAKLHFIADTLYPQFRSRYERKYGMVFEIPIGLSVPCLTLLELLSLEHRRIRPTLGLRFRIAHSIGRAIQKWHSVEWVHEDICSANIAVFQNPDTHAWVFSKPFLGGFQSSRREVDFSNGSTVEDFERNVYRHPSRQDVPLERHDMSHDYYAYGVLLLEIGLWQTVSEHRYFEETVKALTRSEGPRIGPAQIRERLIKLAKQSLGHFMGSDYRDAALMCLEDKLETCGDEYRTQLSLRRTFEAKVLDQIANGLVLN